MDNQAAILDRIARGRTDHVLALLRLPGWRDALHEGKVNALQWFVYYNDVTALQAVLEAGGDLAGIDLNEELGNAAFFGHWKVCDFLLCQGADVNCTHPQTGETPLHNALCKAGRPYFLYVVRLLVERGATINAQTKPDCETGAFMRDVRTAGETPLHRPQPMPTTPSSGFCWITAPIAKPATPTAIHLCRGPADTCARGASLRCWRSATTRSEIVIVNA